MNITDVAGHPQTREKDVITVLADKTFPQIRAIDRAYHEKFDKSLLQLISSEKSLRGNSESLLSRPTCSR
jgi:hypothetical protein